MKAKKRNRYSSGPHKPEEEGGEGGVRVPVKPKPPRSDPGKHKEVPKEKEKVLTPASG